MPSGRATADVVPEPSLAQFTDANEWGKALEDWTTNKTERDLRVKEAEKSQAERREKAAKNWSERQKAFGADAKGPAARCHAA